MDLKSLLGNVALGQDTSGNIQLSVYGPAVKTPDGRFVAFDKEKGQLVNVSDLTLGGTESFIYRVPAKKAKKGDLIITNDDPFAALFVREDGDVNGPLAVIDPFQEIEVRHIPLSNILRLKFYVKAVSPIPESRWGGKDDARDGDFDDKLLPLLLLSGSGNDNFAKILLLQGLGGRGSGLRGFEHNPLLLLSLLSSSGQSGTTTSGQGSQSDALQTLLLMQAFEEEDSPPPGGGGGGGSKKQP